MVVTSARALCSMSTSSLCSLLQQPLLTVAAAFAHCCSSLCSLLHQQEHCVPSARACVQRQRQVIQERRRAQGHCALARFAQDVSALNHPTRGHRANQRAHACAQLHAFQQFHACARMCERKGASIWRHKHTITAIVC
jgi:hypothetical protein